MHILDAAERNMIMEKIGEAVVPRKLCFISILSLVRKFMHGSLYDDSRPDCPLRYRPSGAIRESSIGPSALF